MWLEDQKIRHYKVEDREALRARDSPKWDETYRKYLYDIACPIRSKNQKEELEWLLAMAIRLEYADNSEKYKNETSDALIQNETSKPKVVSANVLDNLDFQAEEFVTGVNKLANLVKVTPHPDHLVTLRAVSKVVQDRLSQNALENPNSVIVTVCFNIYFIIKHNTLGFYLNLMFFRELHFLFKNSTLVSTQEITF